MTEDKTRELLIPAVIDGEPTEIPVKVTDGVTLTGAPVSTVTFPPNTLRSGDSFTLTTVHEPAGTGYVYVTWDE